MSTLAEQIAWLEKFSADFTFHRSQQEAILSSLRSLEAAERDANRYRWLRDLSYWKHEPSLIHVPLIEWTRASALSNDGVDAAIDSAMVQK